jgi:hypothetical protein
MWSEWQEVCTWPIAEAVTLPTIFTIEMEADLFFTAGYS